MFTACMAKVVDAKEALKIKLPAQIKAGKEVVIQCTNSISPNWFLDGEKIKGKVVLIDAKVSKGFGLCLIAYHDLFVIILRPLPITILKRAKSTTSR